MAGCSVMRTWRSDQTTPTTRGSPRRPSPRPTTRRGGRGGLTATSQSGASSWTTWRGMAPTGAGMTVLADSPGRQCWSPMQVTRGAPPRSARVGGARVAVEQFAYLSLAEPAVATGRPNAANPAGCGPPCDSLRVDSEECGYFPRCEQALTVAVHRLLLPVPEGLPQVSQKLAKL